MNKSIKIVSLLFVLISFLACDSSSDDVALSTTLMAKYTFIKEQSPGKVTFLNTSENADSFEWDFGDGTTSIVKNPVKIFTETGDYQVTLTSKNTKTGVSESFVSTVSIFVFAGGLITNGDFEIGSSPWTLGITTPIAPSLLITDSGNTYFSIDVLSAGNPYDVNLSQKALNLVQDKTYRLTFSAWSNVNRTIVVGIGLSGPPFTNQSVTRNITPTLQNFSIDLVANFTSTNSRVLFDMGAAVGKVNIDNVALIELP
jgi:PKD repeat protein